MLIKQIINHEDASYIVKLVKSMQSFINENEQIDVPLIEKWARFLECDKALPIHNNQILFLKSIEECEIVG